MKIEILYEDKDVVAINKPTGLIIHSDGKTKEKTLVDWILEKYPGAKEVGEPLKIEIRDKSNEIRVIPRPGIVHRLDRETSGVMLVAKTQKGFEHLKKQFVEHEIKKTYHAFVFGEMKNDKGVIDRPIGRSTRDFRLWSAQRGARGELREAITEYEVVLRGKGYSFVHVFPKTGRTHQIRAHFKAINYPLVGDSLYAPSRENMLGFTRTALHSYEVTFKDMRGDLHTVTASEPEDFTRGLKALQAS